MLVLSNNETAEKMGKNGIRLIREKFNWEKEKEKLFEVYSGVLNTEA